MTLQPPSHLNFLKYVENFVSFFYQCDLAEPLGSGSGSTSQRYGSGSGFFYHQAKNGRKTMIPTVL
jgi:hypothetical protein